MGPRGATIFCHNSSAPRGASSFGQIWADREQIFDPIPM